jgi:hypothetical protein
LNQNNYNSGILQSPNDNLSAINLDQYYESYRLMVAYLVYLDHGLDPSPRHTTLAENLSQDERDDARQG